MSTFAYNKVGQYSNEVVTYIEKNKGVLKATDQKKYTISTDGDSTFKLFAKHVKAQQYALAEKLVREKQFEVLEPKVRPDRFTTLGWTQIEKKVFTVGDKITTKQQEQISLLIIKNVLGGDTQHWESFDEMFEPRLTDKDRTKKPYSEIKELFPKLRKLLIGRSLYI